MNEFWTQFFILYENKQQTYSKLADISYIVPVLFGFIFLLIVWWVCFGSSFKVRTNNRSQTNKVTESSLNASRDNLKVRIFGLIVLMIWTIALLIFLSKPLSGDKRYIGMDAYEYRHLQIYKSLNENEQKIVNKVMVASNEVGAISKNKDVKAIYDFSKIKEFHKIENIEQLEEIRAEQRGEEFTSQLFWFAIFIFPFASAVLFG